MLKEFFYSFGIVYTYGIYLFFGGLILLLFVMSISEVIEDHKQNKKDKEL